MTTISVEDREGVKVLTLRPGDILVVDPNMVYRMSGLRQAFLSFPVPIVLARPEGFEVIRFEAYDDGS